MIEDMNFEVSNNFQYHVCLSEIGTIFGGYRPIGNSENPCTLKRLPIGVHTDSTACAASVQVLRKQPHPPRRSGSRDGDGEPFELFRLGVQAQIAKHSKMYTENCMLCRQYQMPNDGPTTSEEMCGVACRPEDSALQS